MQLQGQSEGYRLYQTRREGMEAKIHAVRSLFGEENVADIEYASRKRLVEKFRRKSDVIFVIFDKAEAEQMSQSSFKERSEHL